MRVVAAFAALAAVLYGGIGLALAGDSGQLITRGFAPLPSPLVVNVEPDDNTRTNMTLADRLSRELGRRGYEVLPSTAAPLVLRFDSEIRSNVTTAQGRYQREPSGAADSDMSIGAAGPPDRPVGVANLLSSAPGRSVMGMRGSDDYTRPLRYVVNARIEDRSSGSVMWQGHASYDSDRSDADPILEAMVPLLAAEVGQTVRDRRFSLD